MSIFAVELKITKTFSSYLIANSQEDAEREMKARAAQLQPDSVVYDAVAYQETPCQMCGEEHFGPACQPPPIRAKQLKPSWERAQL